MKILGIIFEINKFIHKLVDISFFRLWLISEPIPNFHSVLAQNSMKVVFETSQGIKNNIIRTLSRYGKHYFEKLDGKSGRIFFAASCIHALLQERRKFIPQGKYIIHQIGTIYNRIFCMNSRRCLYVKIIRLLWKEQNRT